MSTLDFSKCGTLSNYNAHIRLKEFPCQPCKDANARKSKEQYEANKLHRQYMSRKNYEKNKNKISLQRQHPQRLKKHKEYCAQYWKNNKEELSAKNKEYMISYDKEKSRASNRAHYQANKEIYNVKSRRRRALKAKVTTEDFTVEDVISLYGLNCYICRTPIDFFVSGEVGKAIGWEKGLHLEHVTALSKGGEHTLKNVRPAHAICNLKKGSKEALAYEN